MSKRKQLETLLTVNPPESIDSLNWGRTMDDISTALNLAWDAPEVDPTQGYFREAMLRARAIASSGAQAGQFLGVEDRGLLVEALHEVTQEAFDILLEG